MQGFSGLQKGKSGMVKWQDLGQSRSRWNGLKELSINNIFVVKESVSHKTDGQFLNSVEDKKEIHFEPKTCHACDMET